MYFPWKLIKDILKWNPSWFCEFLYLERFNNLFDSHIINSYLICLAMFSILYLSCKLGIREKKWRVRLIAIGCLKRNNESEYLFHMIAKGSNTCLIGRSICRPILPDIRSGTRGNVVGPTENLPDRSDGLASFGKPAYWFPLNNLKDLINSNHFWYRTV